MKKLFGILCCALLAVPAYLLGTVLPVIGAPVFGILLGMLSGLVIKDCIIIIRFFKISLNQSKIYETLFKCMQKIGRIINCHFDMGVRMRFQERG